MQTRKLHIMHVVHRFDTGGLENGVVNLINSLDENAYQHSIVALQGYEPEFCKRIKTSNTTFHDLKKKDGNDLKIFFKLRKLLKTLRPDLFHTRNTATLEMQLMGWWCDVSYRVHGEHGWDVNDMHGQNKKYQLLRKLVKPFVHRYIALSQEAQQYLLDTINVAKERIYLICNGVDTSKFCPGKCTLADRPPNFELPGLMVFGTVGRLAEVKNQTLLLDSFIALTKQHPDEADKLRLIIVGDGVLMNSLMARTKGAGLSEQVWFAGNRSDVADLMRCFDVFVLPSLAEGISNTILEAMATGLPVIATNVGGNPDLIQEGLHDSHLVTSNSILELTCAMEQYLEDSDLLLKNSTLVREHCVQNISIATMVDKYHQLYQVINQ